MGANCSHMGVDGIPNSPSKGLPRSEDMCLITLILHYGGVFVHKPWANYVAGKRHAFDYLDIKGEVSISRLISCCEELGILGEKIFHVVEDNTFKPLYNDKDLLEAVWKCEEKKLLEIYVEIIQEAVDEEELLKYAEEAVREDGFVNHEESCDLVESDYQFDSESSYDVDEGAESVSGVVDKGKSSVVDKGKSNIEVEYDEDDSSGDEDVVCDDDDFDEKRESDDDSGYDVFPRFNREVIYNPVFVLGMKFDTKELFKKAVTSLAIKTKRSLYFKKNDKIRVHVRCRAEGCGWTCNALKKNDEATFQIRTYKPVHNCAPCFHVTNMSSTWLGEKHLSDFQSDPKRNMKGWRKDVMRQMNISVSNQQSYRARKKALQIIEGVPDLQYSKLWDYAEALRSSNPGSNVVLDIDQDGKFSAMFVCFEAVKRGFLSGCRPIIGVDGCWLKGPRGGILLAAVGVDPSNAIYPIAYAVVSVENKQTWEWFLINLKHSLGITEAQKYTFMSDKQKGLILAMRDVFPTVEHRHCVRHLHNNFVSAGFRGEEYKNALWAAARASTVGMFNERMMDIFKKNEAAAKWLDDKDPSQWSKSHFTEDSKCDMLLNNVCESFNSCILDAREKPILTMLEWIRLWMMERFQTNRDRAEKKWKGRLPPKIVQTLRRHMDAMSDCIPMKSTTRYYQIQCSDASLYAVDLEQMKCSCRLWELSGIPCKHAISALVDQGSDPELFVHDCYTVETYKKVYALGILPIVGEVDWAKTMFIPPMPPNFGRKRGRPTKARRMQPEEKGKKKAVKLKRQYRKKGCKRCGDLGHTMKRCKRPKESAQTTTIQTSAPAPSTTTTAPPPVQTSTPPPVQTSTPPPVQTPTSIPVHTPKSLRPKHCITRGRGASRRGGRGVYSSGSNMRANPPSSGLVDQDDSEFEALLSQANSGMVNATFISGPTPWDQLMVVPPSPPIPVAPVPTTRFSGGLRPMFSSQTLEATAKNKIFVNVKGKQQAE